MSKRSRVTSASNRLKQDYLRLKRDPIPYISAEPLPSNILEWHYVVDGPENSPYEGGLYHGKLVFPSAFPFKPPSIYMTTPNGRFSVNKRLCLSISDFHPDTWNPAWSVGTILTGLLSFMLEKTPTLGSIQTSDLEKRQYAQKSLEFNLKSGVFKELFPESCVKAQQELDRRAQLRHSLSAASPRNPSADANSTKGRDLAHQDTFFNGAITNFLVIGGFAAFAFLVKHVIQTIAAADSI